MAPKAASYHPEDLWDAIVAVHLEQTTTHCVSTEYNVPTRKVREAIEDLEKLNRVLSHCRKWQ